MRHLMDKRNHDIVHIITNKIGNMFNPFLENTIRSYQQLTHQMGKIADLLGAPSMLQTLVPNILQGVNPLENRIVENDQSPEDLNMVLVQRNQDGE